MRSPAAAVGWEFRQQHRWGLIVLIGYLLVVAAIKLVVITRALPITLDSPESFAFVVMMPLVATFTYFLAVFTFGLDGDLAARQSMYPARLFTLPVPTAALAGWPMLYGAAAAATLCTVTRLIAPWPPSVHVPAVWPGILAVAHLGW